jgi:uroporphyrinogen decarboxylase
MTSRERILATLNFQTPDRLPRDLSGMRSTGISAFVYPALVKALGLPYRRPKVYDCGQMLALPDLDVLDALGCDVITVEGTLTNAFDQPEKWEPYDFNGRLDALVPKGAAFTVEPDGTIVSGGVSRMVPASYVFDSEHAGMPLNLTDELPKQSLDEFRKDVRANALTDREIAEIRDICRRVRTTTDRAVFLAHRGLYAHIGIGSHGGYGVFPLLCVLEPDYVRAVHEIAISQAVENARRLLPVIRDYVDILLLSADDWGTQNTTIASPDVYKTLFQPYYRRLNDECHRWAPAAKTFLHSCGAIYDIIDPIIQSGFDILNPVQWSAGKASFRDWKDRARGRITLWGGGVNSQVTLPRGSVRDVETETRTVAACLRKDNGFVLCNIHNILAEIPPEKVIALYRSVPD